MTKMTNAVVAAKGHAMDMETMSRPHMPRRSTVSWFGRLSEGARRRVMRSI